MAAYRFYDPASVFWNILGTAGLRQGSVQFYEIGTTNPKNTWSDKDLSVLNLNPLNLDASGRFPDDVFLDGEYTIVLYDGLNGTGQTVWTRNVIGGGDAGTEIPALVDGFVLSNNGATLVWVDPDDFLPDPTGQTGKALVSTGAGYTFQAFPEAPELDIVVSDGSQRVGDGVDATKSLTQYGSDTAPANPGSTATTKSVTFATLYSTTPAVMVLPTSSSQPGGPVVVELTARSTTGFTAKFDVAEGSASGASVVNTVPFNWIAIGTVEVP